VRHFFEQHETLARSLILSTFFLSDDFACPGNWYWHTNKECCAPKTKKDANAIDCPSGFLWTPKKSWCKSQCTRLQFWYASLEICLPKGGISYPPSPPYVSSDTFYSLIKQRD